MTIYSPKVLAKSQKARTHTVGHISIFKYGAFLLPIPLAGNFLFANIYSFSSKGRNLLFSGSSLTKNVQVKNQSIPSPPLM